jgi:aspartyl-tRNA(Asn)/glutamyl-tRNA(Gln) amidotransferase subunit B
MRSKEQSHDYRYFPEPDLPPLVLTTELIETERETLPELPRAKRERLAAQHGLGTYEAGVITADVVLADYFERVVAAGADPRNTANWVMTEVMTGFNETGNLEVDPPRLARLITMVSENIVSLQAAKKVFVALRTDPNDPEVIAKRLGLIQVRDTGALEAWVDEVLAAHPEEVARYRGGETKLLGFLVGQVMKRSRGKADPVGVQPVLRARLES